MPGLWAAFRLLAGWRRIGGWLAAAGAWLRGSAQVPHAAIALVLAGAAWWGWGLHLAKAELADIRAAQAEAGQRQAAVNHVPAARSAAIARASDADHSLEQAGDHAGDRYAAAHRVRGPACSPGAAGVPGTDRAAPLDDGRDRGSDAELVAVSRDDFDRCTAAAVRLAKVHRDAESLIAAGVAVPGNDAGN